MAERLDSTVALVTGASSGIGEATARALAHEGATVAVAARLRDRLDELVNDIEAFGGKALAVEADVTERHVRVSLVERGRSTPSSPTTSETGCESRLGTPSPGSRSSSPRTSPMRSSTSSRAREGWPSTSC